MSKRSGLSIRWKLVLTSILVEAIMLGALAWNGLRLMDESLQRLATTRLNEVSVLLNAALAPQMAMQDYAPIADVFKQSLQQDGIQYFVLTDARGKRLLADGWSSDATLPAFQAPSEANINVERIDLRIPITLSSQIYGYLHFGISTQFLQEARQHLKQQSLIIAALAIVLTLLLLLAIAHWLTRHLKKLERASKAVSNGDYSVTVSVNSKDEIGHLGDAFNRMTQHIGQQVAELSSSEERFKSLLNLSTDLYWEQDKHFRFTRRDTSRLVEDSRNLLDLLIGKRRWELDTTLTPAEWQRHIRTLEAHEIFHDFEYGIHRPDGSTSYHSIHGEPIFDDAGNFSGYRGTASDITKRKEIEASLRLSAIVFAEAHESIVICDTAWRVIDLNPMVSEMTGFSRGELLGNDVRQQFALDHSDFDHHVLEQIDEEGHWRGEGNSLRKSGERFPALLTISAVAAPTGKTLNYIFIFSDITALKLQQEKLEALAHYDVLTRLPNRVLFADRLQQSLHQAKRRNELLAIAYLDLDGFKPINDCYGHDAGDALLIEVANRLTNCVRKSDTAARLGGDEFVLLLRADDFGECEAALLRVLGALSSEFDINGNSVSISASIGVTVYPHDNSDPDVLLRHADQAMYLAKQSGRNRYHFFDSEQDQLQQSHNEKISRIEAAFDAEEFVLFYQPKVDMRSGQIYGAEALIRWQHPERGIVSPAEFLPLIEETAFSVKLGEWVVRSAFNQLKIWQKIGLTVTVSVNVTPRHIQSPNFVSQLRELLDAHPTVAPATIEFEIVESAALDDIQHISKIMNECVAFGISFALDDFGTGYSSLTYFRHLPAQTLKIDQSFIRDMLADPEDLAIAQGVIGLAQVFKRTVIAEGVETAAHGTRLMEMGCYLAQGYGIARPMPAGELPGWIENYCAPSAWTQSRT
jgi:diguanylate cyclase (GGDEF)-like protein/PAS domain S-box-containing protein